MFHKFSEIIALEEIPPRSTALFGKLVIIAYNKEFAAFPSLINWIARNFSCLHVTWRHSDGALTAGLLDAVCISPMVAKKAFASN